MKNLVYIALPLIVFTACQKESLESSKGIEFNVVHRLFSKAEMNQNEIFNEFYTENVESGKMIPKNVTFYFQNVRDNNDPVITCKFDNINKVRLPIGEYTYTAYLRPTESLNKPFYYNGLLMEFERCPLVTDSVVLYSRGAFQVTKETKSINMDWAMSEINLIIKTDNINNVDIDYIGETHNISYHTNKIINVKTRNKYYSLCIYKDGEYTAYSIDFAPTFTIKKDDEVLNLLRIGLYERHRFYYFDNTNNIFTRTNSKE